MSMMVRKATLVRKGRTRKSQSQRIQREGSVRWTRGSLAARGSLTPTTQRAGNPQGSCVTARAASHTTWHAQSCLPASSSNGDDRSHCKATHSLTTQAAAGQELSRCELECNKSQSDAVHQGRRKESVLLKERGPPRSDTGGGANTTAQGSQMERRDSRGTDSSDGFHIPRRSVHRQPSQLSVHYRRPSDGGKQWHWRNLISRDSDENLLEAAACSSLLAAPVIRHVGSSLRESELSKPQTDLPFTRADLPQRHSSLPARLGLKKEVKVTPPLPSPVLEDEDSPTGVNTVFFAPLAVSTAAGSACSASSVGGWPRRYPLGPHACGQGLDYPLRRPDSEKAYRELAERRELQRTLLAQFCVIKPTTHRPSASPLHFWDHQAGGYQEDGQQEWRLPSVDNCQRSQLLQQVLEANKDADTPLDFVCRLLDILSSTVVFTVLVFLSLAVPIIMISVGVKYLEDCPLERRIPVYLLVGGCFLALKLLGMLWKNVQLRRYDNMDAFYDSPDNELAVTSRTFRMMDWILSAFLLAWHVTGACWTLSVWRPAYSPDLHSPSHYCHSSVYLCAIVELALSAISLLLFLLLCAGLALCYKYTGLFEQ